MIKLNSIILAQTNSICDPNSPNLCNPTHAGSLQIFIGDILNGAAILIGVVTIAMVVYSGIRMIISQGNEEEVSKAKSSLQWSLAGFVLVLLAYVITSSVSNFFGAREVDVNGSIQNPITIVDILNLSTRIFQQILGIAGMIAMLYIILNGFRYITSRGDDEQASQAKRGLQWAVIGLVIAVLAYVIVAAVLSLLDHDIYTSGGRVVPSP